MKLTFICKCCGKPFKAYYLSGRKYCGWTCSHFKVGIKHKAPWLTKRNKKVNAKQARDCANKIRLGQPNLGKSNGRTYAKLNGKHEHRRVMETKLGRKLLSSEIVHHKDENKRNNHPDNLVLTNRADHARIHFSKK